jgi:CrcB protein
VSAALPLRDALLVIAGGGGGALARWFVASVLPKGAVGGFPLAILLVNVAGCFALGGLVAYLGRTTPPRPELAALLGVGFCGGFTTFSTFAIDALELMDEGRLGGALLYVFASVALGIAAAALGLLAAR